MPIPTLSLLLLQTEMTKSKISSLLFLLICLISVEARKHNVKKSKHHYKPTPSLNTNMSRFFDIFSFGAKGDGVSDDSKALLSAWKAACNVPCATLHIPSKFDFFIKPITLQGPCMPYLVLQVDGTLLAPRKVGSWPKSSLFQWINFKWVHNFTISGSGTVDGQGCEWWNPHQIHSIQKKSTKHIPNTKPTALRFYASYNVTVQDINIINSPQCHLKFDSSRGIKVSNLTISSPENSPNTDGIHLQNTQDVEIQQTDIRCGDDCVSIQTGCSNVHIHHLNCGPGHGISIGGLGKDKSVACVSDIIVDNISFQNTLSGVRVKTWQGGIGSVKNVSFSNIEVSNVKVPIIIDQYYCDKNFCKNQTGAVEISGIKYDQIIGTFSVQPIHLACSNNVPCIDVELIDIQLKPSLPLLRKFQQALCWNTYGISRVPLVPSSIDYCLRSGRNSVNKIVKSRKNVC